MDVPPPPADHLPAPKPGGFTCPAPLSPANAPPAPASPQPGPSTPHPPLPHSFPFSMHPLQVPEPSPSLHTRHRHHRRGLELPAAPARLPVDPSLLPTSPAAAGGN